MLIELLKGSNPLESIPLNDVIPAYERLLAEVMKWKVSSNQLGLPMRIWLNKNKWSDCVAVYALREDEAQLLTLAPVAKQRVPRCGEFSSVRVMKKTAAARLHSELRLASSVVDWRAWETAGLTILVDEPSGEFLFLVEKRSKSPQPPVASVFIDKVLSFSVSGGFVVPADYPYVLELNPDLLHICFSSVFVLELRQIRPNVFKLAPPPKPESAPPHTSWTRAVMGPMTFPEVELVWAANHPALLPVVTYSPQSFANW